MNFDRTVPKATHSSRSRASENGVSRRDAGCDIQASGKDDQERQVRGDQRRFSRHNLGARRRDQRRTCAFLA